MKMGENIIVHCPTIELAEDVLMVMKSVGYSLCSDLTIPKLWLFYGDKLCLHAISNIISHRDIDGYKDENCEIIEAEEFLKLHKEK